jgi:hypothetical protein
MSVSYVMMTNMTALETAVNLRPNVPQILESIPSLVEGRDLYNAGWRPGALCRNGSNRQISRPHHRKPNYFKIAASITVEDITAEATVGCSTTKVIAKRRLNAQRRVRGGRTISQ